MRLELVILLVKLYTLISLRLILRKEAAEELLSRLTSLKYTPENCFIINKQKRKEFEEKSGKKWILYAEWLKKNKKEGESKTDKTDKSDKKKTGSRKKKEKDDDSDDSSIFGAALLLCFPTITASIAMFSHRNKSRWLFDTGATEYISNNLLKFTLYTLKDDLPYILTVNRPLRPTGIRSYTIKAMKSDGSSLVCLYSGSKLNNLGGYLRSSVLYTSKEKEICIINKNLFIIKETFGAGYASLPGLSLPAVVEQATVDIELWHRRIYHASFDVVHRTQSMVTSMKFTELKTSRTRLCALYEKGRPIRKYYRKIKVWRYDGGKEYSLSQMKELADYLGILLEESTPYTLEQDGRAERSIRTIIEKPEILLAYIHIANLTSTSRVEGKTPFECFWDDIKLGVNYTPSIKYLRVLGCPVFILIDKEKRV
ncbi:uncharacterized protein RAG0_06335 [Rhynchosporium agropyri]|uniref:Integrase catalytic domain-containing protein n=1 Tax=Rhynchosporium agropyri TaxID=914238 RepID=A0A1E1KK41_9HELO|nr:uncharacterized protein RAG0_06335 [Rhynchosporium agropyri]